MLKSLIRVRGPTRAAVSLGAYFLTFQRNHDPSKRLEWHSVTSQTTWALKFIVSPLYGIIKSLTNKVLQPNIVPVCLILCYESQWHRQFLCVYIQSRNQTVGVLIRSTNHKLLYLIRICHWSDRTTLMWKFLFKYCQVCQCFVLTTQQRGGQVDLAVPVSN